MLYTGKKLIEMGYNPSKLFGDFIKIANDMHVKGYDVADIRKEIDTFIKENTVLETPFRTNSIPYANFLEPENNDDSIINSQKVEHDMDILLRTPTIVKSAIMPDACPAGTIPVGAVVACKDAIHPGFHSSDVCCSMAISTFKRNDDITKVMDVIDKLTHFGHKKRDKQPIKLSHRVAKLIEGNSFLSDLLPVAYSHFTTQGDGNHFYFLGHLESSGNMSIVSHHGSRGLGARLYKKGLKAAQKHTSIVSPKTPKKYAWLDANSDIGREYWDALQIVKMWTNENHFALHNAIGLELDNKIIDQHWNEHNFVFKREDGLFYHAKGATPSYDGYDRTIIPMNMSEPILLTKPGNNINALSFAPHGAGRNVSRTTFLKNNSPKIPKNLDIRFQCGKPDLSELPEAYKNSSNIIKVIEDNKLAEIYDRVIPSGSIMAGDTSLNWKK